MLSRTLIIWEKEDVRFDLVWENETSRSVDNRTVRARQGLNIQKKEISSGYLLFCIIESTRRDSNPRPSPWQGDTPPLSHSCVSGYHHDSMDLLKCQDKKSVVYCGGYEKIYWSGQHMEAKEEKAIGNISKIKGNGYVKRRTGRKTDPVFDTVSVQQYFTAAV